MRFQSYLLTQFKRNAEVLIWCTALILLYLMPEGGGHFTLCPIGALGFTWCPGCGIGHAIHHILHLEFAEAMRHHFLGLFAVLVIGHRIFSLLMLKHKHKLHYHG